MTLNKTSPVPLYYQLAELLREQIRQGHFLPGAQVPSERQLSEQYNISRMTARQAVAYLIREGALMVRRGFGTFVAEPKFSHDALHLFGFSEEVARRGGTAISQVLEQRLAYAPSAVNAALQISAETPLLKIVRLRLADGVPLLLETSFVPLAVCPPLRDADLAAQSLFAALERHGVVLNRTKQELEATVANEYECELFDLPAHAPMILLAGITYDIGDRPIEYFKAIYRGDRFRFTFESERSDGLEQQNSSRRMSIVLA